MSTFIERLEGEARERLICWLRRRMMESEITIEALEHALNRDAEDEQMIRYRDAYGNTWTGLGEMPEWLRHAVAGPEHRSLPQRLSVLMRPSREGHAMWNGEAIPKDSHWQRIMVRNRKLPFVPGNSKAAPLSRYVLKQPDART